MADLVLEACHQDARREALSCELSASSSGSLPASLTDGSAESVLECPDGSVLTCAFAGAHVTCACELEGETACEPPATEVPPGR